MSLGKGAHLHDTGAGFPPVLVCWGRNGPRRSAFLMSVGLSVSLFCSYLTGSASQFWLSYTVLLSWTSLFVEQLCPSPRQAQAACLPQACFGILQACISFLQSELLRAKETLHLWGQEMLVWSRARRSRDCGLETTSVICEQYKLRSFPALNL